MSSSQGGVSLLFCVLRDVPAVQNRKGVALIPNINLTFYELFDDGVVAGGVFIVLIRLFEAHITLLFEPFLSSVVRHD